MRKEIFQKIKIPQEVEVEIDKNTIVAKGKDGEMKKKFNLKGIVLKKENNELIVGHTNATKKDKREINTTYAHIKNMIEGVQKKFEYKLKICSSHFPITVEIKGKEATIKNFLGEKTPRKAEILEGADVRVDKDIITITSSDKNLAGQTSANFENATKIRKRDRRIFQDGIFIMNKAGREI
ncbi:MAG: 50S ribosomal protein L6 [archaeon]